MMQRDLEDPRQEVTKDTHLEVDLILEIDTKEDIDLDLDQIHETEEEEEIIDELIEEKVVLEVYQKANQNHRLMIQADNNKMINQNLLQMKIIIRKKV